MLLATFYREAHEEREDSFQKKPSCLRGSIVVDLKPRRAEAIRQAEGWGTPHTSLDPKKGTATRIRIAHQAIHTKTMLKL